MTKINSRLRLASDVSVERPVAAITLPASGGGITAHPAASACDDRAVTRDFAAIPHFPVGPRVCTTRVQRQAFHMHRAGSGS
jgi:hypothetical protein